MKEKEYKVSLTELTDVTITAKSETLAVKKFLRGLVFIVNKGKTQKNFKILGPFDLTEFKGDEDE
jgi:hypothetical protein